MLCFSKQLSVYQKLVIIFHLLDKCRIKFSCLAFTVVRRQYFYATSWHLYRKGAYGTSQELPASISQQSHWVTANLGSHDDNHPWQYYPACTVYKAPSLTCLYSRQGKVLPIMLLLHTTPSISSLSVDMFFIIEEATLVLSFLS